MKYIIILTMIAVAQSVSSQTDIEGILNKTWISYSGFGGSQYVFYRIGNGEVKAIKQVLGSGVCAVKSEIFDIEIKSDTIEFLNGLDLKSDQSVSIENIKLNLSKNELHDQQNQLMVISKTLVIYNWATEEICDLVDFERLKTLPLNRNEIYNLKTIQQIGITSAKTD